MPRISDAPAAYTVIREPSRVQYEGVVRQVSQPESGNIREASSDAGKLLFVYSGSKRSSLRTAVGAVVLPRSTKVKSHRGANREMCSSGAAFLARRLLLKMHEYPNRALEFDRGSTALAF